MSQSPQGATTFVGAAEPDRPIACDLTAIPAAERDAHVARATALLLHASQERLELPNGFGWRFAAESYREIAEYVANERRCCPFLSFAIEVAPAGGAVWLRITGDGPIKAFLRSELVPPAP